MHVDPLAAHAVLMQERRLPSEGYSDGPLSDPLLLALRDVVRAHDLPEAYPADLLAGMDMDVRGAVKSLLAWRPT